MVLVVLCCLFVFLGMYIGKRFDFKNVSINIIFGLFLINCLFNVLPVCFSILSHNYHDMTFIYVLLGCVLGYILMTVISFKYDETDNISIAGFSLFNCYLLCVSKVSFFVLVVNIIYYILIGIYVCNSKSWVSVFIGAFLGFLLSFVSGWLFGYVFTIVFGFMIYFVLSVYGLVFRSNSKLHNIGLIVGLIVALLGCVL